MKWLIILAFLISHSPREVVTVNEHGWVAITCDHRWSLKLRTAPFLLVNAQFEIKPQEKVLTGKKNGEEARLRLLSLFSTQRFWQQPSSFG